MATLALAVAGAAAGGALLPAGVSFLGATLSGAAIGSQVGALAGGFIDQALLAPSGQPRTVQGPRLSELRVTSSRLYARMHAWFREAIQLGIARGEFTVADPTRTIDRLLALIDGYGIRTLIEDPAMPLERARAEIWDAIAPDLAAGHE